MKLIGHQGDVCFFKVEALPQGLVQDKQTDNAILAYGEGSGHAHQLDDLDAVQVWKEPGTNLIYLNVLRQTSVSHGRARDFVGREADHDYHKSVTLDPGLYAAGIIEETDWISKTIRRVVD
jgi:hypothetical protein